jgi:hypothetical protein
LFANRRHVAANIIVDDGEARPASKIEEVREILGVLPSDNLRHAELVLVVEGAEDIPPVTALLSTESRAVRRALEGGSLALDALLGSGNLTFKAGLSSRGV